MLEKKATIGTSANIEIECYIREILDAGVYVELIERPEDKPNMSHMFLPWAVVTVIGFED